MSTQTNPQTTAASGQPADAGRITVGFEAGPSAAASARRALLALEGRVDPDLMGDLKLLVTELITNSVRHSSASAREAVELDVLIESGTLRVEVRDRGSGFDPRPRTPGQSKAGGWGLFLVDRLADRWGVVCNSVTHVWFEIDCRRTPARA